MWLLPKPRTRIAVAVADAEIALTYADGTAIYNLSSEEKTALVKAYELYDNEHGRPRISLTACGLLTPCLQALYAAYAEVQKTGRLKFLRQQLLSEAETCPFCGFGEPTQLDHHLPKDRYKWLAIYLRNLVPSCGPCNNVKRAHVGTGSDDLVHAYFDVLPSDNFLIANVKMESSALVVEFEIDLTVLDPDLADRLRFQLERMQLNTRYPKQINVFLFGQRTGMLHVFNSKGPGALRKYLTSAADGLDLDFGQHDWRAALLRGLANCNAFCDGGITRYFTGRRRRRP
jgi:hypothetical protein